MDRRFADATQHDLQVEAAISNYQMAWRMQSAVPELCDVSGESEATKKLYGIDGPADTRTAYGQQCLLARRLVERGVRFVELIDVGSSNNWDAHGDMLTHARLAVNVDQAIAGLLRDRPLYVVGVLSAMLFILAVTLALPWLLL